MNEYKLIIKFFNARRNTPMNVNYIAKWIGISNFRLKRWLKIMVESGEVICFDTGKRKLYSLRIFISNKKLMLRKIEKKEKG